jgi:hypothetical protein
MGNIGTNEYFLKNYISQMLGMIAAKEFPRCCEGFIKVMLENLINTNDNNMIDTYLRIITDVLKEGDDRFAIAAGDILPVILKVFKESSVK